MQEDFTFAELFERWKDYKKVFIGAKNTSRGLSPSTIRRYELDYDKYIKNTKFAKTPIHKITKTTLELFLTSIIEQNNMNEKCAGNLIGYFTQSFDYAKHEHYIKDNFAKDLDRDLLLSKCVSHKHKLDSDRILTITEMAKLRTAILNHSKRYPFYMPDYAIELAMLTGMRVGELAALSWTSIDNTHICVRYSEHRFDYADKGCELSIGATKNGKIRYIPLTEDMRNLLDRIRSLNLPNNNELLFVRENGQRYTAHDISCAVDRRASEAGIKKTSIHGIRRTVSSQLNTVLSQKDVAAMLGHSERVNENHYNYSTAEIDLKQQALSMVSSKVINFSV